MIAVCGAMSLRAEPRFDSLEELGRLEARIEVVVRKALPATVSLFSERLASSGSGVIVSRDGLILTAGHVVTGVREVTVVFSDGKEAEAEVLGANLSKDAGLARLRGEGPWPAVEMGYSEGLEAGDFVVSLGHAGGFDPLRTAPVRFGRIVSRNEGFLGTDCALIGGDSGGPLFDLEGRLVGIHSSIGAELFVNNHTGIDNFRADWDRLAAGEKWGRLKFDVLADPDRMVRGFTLFAAPSASEQRKLDRLAGQVFRALGSVAGEVAGGVVEVRWRDERVGYGTVVASQKVLVKWSEIRGGLQGLACRTGEGVRHRARLLGIYRDDDLALLEVDGLEAEPLLLGEGGDLRLGQFLGLARPDGEAAGMGVVSVLPRTLRASDRGFLGVSMDPTFRGPGVRVLEVQPSTAAEEAGLQPGDVITGIERRAVAGRFELSSILQRLDPEQRVRVKFRRGGNQKAAIVTLGRRPPPPRFPYSRLERMNRMGGHRYNEVRDEFREVAQSDMQIAPEDCGAPVIDLGGRVVGVAAARAGRICTFIIPSKRIAKLLQEAPAAPELEDLARRAEPAPEEGGAAGEDPFDTMRRGLDEMRRLMRELDRRDR